MSRRLTRQRPSTWTSEPASTRWRKIRRRRTGCPRPPAGARRQNLGRPPRRSRGRLGPRASPGPRRWTPSKGDLLEQPLPPEIGEDISERVRPRNLGVAVGAQHEQRQRRSAQQMARQQQGRPIGPMEVVEDEHDRSLHGDRVEQLSTASNSRDRSASGSGAGVAGAIDRSTASGSRGARPAGGPRPRSLPTGRALATPRRRAGTGRPRPRRTGRRARLLRRRERPRRSRPPATSCRCRVRRRRAPAGGRLPGPCARAAGAGRAPTRARRTWRVRR